MIPSALKLLHHAWVDDPERWFPVLAVYYLTYDCDFRCPYCSDGAGRPYYQLGGEPLAAPDVLRLLRVVRRHCEHVVLTGGEPTRHPELGAVLAGLRGLRFRTVVLTTNGYDLEPYLDAMATAVTDLVFSLDTLDHAKADGWYGAGPGALARILENMDVAAAFPGRRYDVMVSCVITPDTLDDLRDVAEHAWARGFSFAACPQLVGVKAHPELKDDPRYRDFYDFLIVRKRAGHAVYGAIPYLEKMRDLTWFRCHPFTMLVVGPRGDVYYPCLELGRRVGNLLEQGDLHTLRQEGRRRFGPQPACDVRCHSACALGFSVALEQPASVLGELYFQGKARVRRLAGRTDRR